MKRFAILLGLASVLVTGLMASKCEVNSYGESGDETEESTPE